MNSGGTREERPVAVVCGSDTSVGSALVARMHRDGIGVVTVDMPGTVASPSVALALEGELGEETAWADIQARIREGGKAPGMLIHAAGVSEGPVRPLELEQAGWDSVLTQNLRSAYLACKYMMPAMTAGGAVVLLGSVTGTLDTRAEAAAFSASQAGLLALMRSLALSGAPDVRVNAVCIGVIGGPGVPDAVLSQAQRRIPLGRATVPEDAVDAIMFLLSEDASYFTGTTLVVDGGQSLQSWSNAPDEPYSSQAPGTGAA